ncbi:hypothetical protein GYMLUDRAFT_176490 [Collybiopsis luxurians FD-317 M1]|uniref:Uncharacterized protein n=1 Tax=Collybiopsis luxurians FD-317 M1 TaxID=944289 RepID=A0A0D0BYM7_9AGAR|nr:hypothetical protein GYMLUDRAFT_176490 [Collybiopsis luxurians FD-317 M1]
MTFPPDHPTHPNQAKGMKVVLQERGLWHDHLIGKCKKKCAEESTDCCARCILQLQPDFVEQKSCIQEIIEAAGHICIMLLKYHCKINFIEYFWGAVKQWLCEHSNYNFATLQENMPKALDSVSVELIWKWEHRSWHFIDAYAENLDSKDALKKVKQFSSRKYKSHRRVPEQLAQVMDV